MTSTRAKTRVLRVRHSYPEAVVELARALAAQRPVREVVRLLDVPASVVYRWRAETDAVVQPAATTVALQALAERCRAHGFHIPADALRVEPRAGIAAPVPDLAPITKAPPSAAPVPVPPPRERRPYVFDTGKERASRGVRRRLEAARREIDARYFAPLDCNALAAAARMSRHHFIRVFGDLFGMSPYRYLLRVRVRAAKRLLLCSREPIDVIAAGVGFRSGPSLNRAFKQSEGASISAFCRVAALRAAGTLRP